MTVGAGLRGGWVISKARYLHMAVRKSNVHLLVSASSSPRVWPALAMGCAPSIWHTVLLVEVLKSLWCRSVTEAMN
jgi:hypothetical protein